MNGVFLEHHLRHGVLSSIASDDAKKRGTMKNTLKIALAAALLIGSVEAGSAATVGFNIGNVSLGFSDGYWDNSHHWHRWAHRGDLERYRTAHHESYHAWRHDDRRHHD
jgi:hypothetical protein